MVTCDFNNGGSFQSFELEPPCVEPAFLLLVVELPDGKNLKELVCKRSDHYTLAHDWLSALGDVTEYSLADVSGRLSA